ncbi:hypothetical protein QAD02_012096 [Eretmocerus hayati]|uniref:Uncharacterized protein n=1 Tax=Eretmocerus hayati TaxID=131215 RepID=A0ACC2P1A7_9HYME|nr:hypothetical protein QAD02_012096 [Eretmocerus hayati]
MASLNVTTSSKNSSRSASPNRANTSNPHNQQQQVTGSADHSSKSRNANTAHQQQRVFVEGHHRHSSDGSGKMKSGGGRQRSPGARAVAEAMVDDSSGMAAVVDPDEAALLLATGATVDDEAVSPIQDANSAAALLALYSPADRCAALILECEPLESAIHQSSFMSNGSSELIGDDVDTSGIGASGGSGRTRQAIEHIQNKIAKTRELIRTEQTTRDENVNEYLKLAANADKQQRTRIKTVFEKKNQKSAHNILQLQKKLDSYTKKLKNYETNGAQMAHRQPREVLRDMGHGLRHVGGNIRDGITGFSGSVMSKPREFAHLIKNKFGSADNINSISHGSTFYVNDPTTRTTGNAGDSGSVEDDGKTHHGSSTLPGGCSLGSNHSQQGTGAAAGDKHHHQQQNPGGTGTCQGGKFPSEEGSCCSSVTSESGPGSRGHAGHTCSHDPGRTCSLKSVYSELQEHKESLERFRERLDGLKTLQQDVGYLSQALQEERFRSERLEEQINDLTELHQNEVENLKQTITDMEEKVQYQSEDRLRDIHEMLESCQTKIWKMEHQQQQHQQYVTLEGLDNSNARALVVKLINVVLTVLQVILLLVATVAGIMMPFLRTSCTKPHCFMCRVRILTTTFVVLGIVFVLKQWPEVHDVGSHLMRHLKQTLAVK